MSTIRLKSTRSAEDRAKVARFKETIATISATLDTDGARVLPPPMMGSEIPYYETWERQMREAGYHCVRANTYTHTHWAACHGWLRGNVGRKYTWVGHMFFFVEENDAFQFRLICQ